MEVKLFGLALLTSKNQLSNTVFEHEGWTLSVRPVVSTDTDEVWDISFTKDRGHGDTAKGRLTCVLNREEGLVEYKKFELRETLPHDVMVGLTTDKTMLCVKLKEATSVLSGYDVEQIIEYNSLVAALMELEMHIEKLLMYREIPS